MSGDSTRDFGTAGVDPATAVSMATLQAIERQLHENIRRFLANVGNKGTCTGCGRDIWWVDHSNGKKAPYTEEGLNHFADCPEAARFKR